MVNFNFSLLTAFVSVCAAAAIESSGHEQQPPSCKCFPGEPCWPSVDAWNQLNATVGGRLVASVPLGAVCHNNQALAKYDAAACTKLQQNWIVPELHYPTPSSPMTSWFANDSCNPFTKPDAMCDNRAFTQYAVRAANYHDYRATFAFATKWNIRLVIRNTGHDYFGKSTGAGSLALWTHFLTETSVIQNFDSYQYKGPALKIGAGVQISQAYSDANAAGLAVAGGACDTVGMAGGFTQGGGLGPLSSYAGLSADQVLEWEVVTADGQHITATPYRHQELYWALSGGGGGTYAAAFSVTVKAYPTMKVAGATLAFSNKGIPESAFASVIQTFLASLPRFTSKKAVCTFFIIGGNFQLVPAFAPGSTVDDLNSLLGPTISALKDNGIQYDLQVKQFESFKDGFDGLVPPINITAASMGGRLIPRSLLESKDGAKTLYEVFQDLFAAGAIVSGVVSDQSKFFVNDNHNAVNPALRKSIMNVVFGIPYNESDYAANIPLQKVVTEKLMPRLEAISPGGAAYLNEADFNQHNWQEAFYGKNYNRLSAIKERYDPKGVFYGLTAVGSDKWENRLNTDGRLCRK